MTRSLLPALLQSGVLERHGGTLRLTPRFAAHADTTAQRLRAQGRWSDPASTVEAALGTWDSYLLDVRAGSLTLWDFMADRHQAGAISPAFPMLEAFAAA